MPTTSVVSERPSSKMEILKTRVALHQRPFRAARLLNRGVKAPERRSAGVSNRKPFPRLKNARDPRRLELEITTVKMTTISLPICMRRSNLYLVSLKTVNAVRNDSQSRHTVKRVQEEAYCAQNAQRNRKLSAGRTIARRNETRLAIGVVKCKATCWMVLSRLAQSI